MHIEKAKKVLTKETDEKIDERLTKAGLEPKTLKAIREELYGLST